MAQSNGSNGIQGTPAGTAQDPRYTTNSASPLGVPQRGAANGSYAERPLGDLVQDLFQEGRELFELELALSKAEMSEKASRAGKDAGFMAVGGFVIYAGFLAIMAAVGLLLANYIPAWISALIVGIVVALIGYALLRKGQGDLKHITLKPQRAVNSLKRDANTIKHEAGAAVRPGGS